MDFWFRYLSVAVLGSLLIYLGAPALKPFLIRQPTSGAPAARPELSVRPALKPISQPATVQDSAASARSASAPEVALPPSEPARTVQPPQELHVAAAPGFTPSTATLPTSGEGVEFWGLTVGACEGRAAGAAGKLHQIPAGQLVEQIGTATGPAGGELAICRVAQNGSWSEPLLIALSDLFRVPGTRADVPAETVDLLQRYYRLRAQLEARRRSQQQALASTNPYFESYRRAYREFNSFTERVKLLTAKRDAAGGEQRMQLADELRAMMPEGNRLEKSFQAAQVQYRSWKAKAGTPATPSTADPELQRLERELAEIEPQVAKLGVQ